MYYSIFILVFIANSITPKDYIKSNYSLYQHTDNTNYKTAWISVYLNNYFHLYDFENH